MIKNGALGSDPRVGAGYEESGNNPRFVRAKRGRARSALFGLVPTKMVCTRTGS